MKNIHILKTSIIKKIKSSKLKTWKPQKSRKYFSEFSYFQVFNFALQPKSKTQIQKAQKTFLRFPGFSSFLHGWINYNYKNNYVTK